MKPIPKLYLKTFLLTGVPYGLLMMGFDLVEGDGFNLWKFLFLTFFFGTTMSLTLVSFHKNRLEINGVQELTDDSQYKPSLILCFLLIGIIHPYL